LPIFVLISLPAASISSPFLDYSLTVATSPPSLTAHHAYAIEFSSLSFSIRSTQQDEKELEIVRYYSFGWHGCQYYFGRISHPVLL
jgi:hypothetical protein